MRTVGETSGSAGEAYCPTCSRSFTLDETECPHDGTRLVRLQTARSLVGKVLDGRYEIVAKLGEGGMGAVYRAQQKSIDRPVAIKVLHASIADNIEAAKRFLREVRLASRLNAPNIVTIFDFGQSDDGLLYLVMELVSGVTLEKVVEHAALPPARAVSIASQLCDALASAHAVSIIHRDLKPGNIIVGSDPAGDLVKVLDFGLAKSIGGDVSTGITNTNALLGTPLYMAPEQIESRPGDTRTDLYALGCILYELLAGRPPYVADTVTALFAMHLHGQPPPLAADVPAELAAIAIRLLAKSPDDRFASAADVKAALESAMPRWNAQTITTAPVAALSQRTESAPSRSRKAWWLAGGVLAAAAVALVAISATDTSMPAARNVAPAIENPADAAIAPAAIATPQPDAAIPAPVAAAPDAAIVATPHAPPPTVRHHPRPPATATPQVQQHPQPSGDDDLPFVEPKH